MTAITHVTLADVLEADARKAMAKRARLPVRWDTRAQRAELRVEIGALIDRWLEVAR